MVDPSFSGPRNCRLEVGMQIHLGSNSPSQEGSKELGAVLLYTHFVGGRKGRGTIVREWLRRMTLKPACPLFSGSLVGGKARKVSEIAIAPESERSIIVMELFGTYSFKRWQAP